MSVAAQGSATRGRGSDNQINLSQQWETDRLQQGRKKGETDHTLGVIAAKSEGEEDTKSKNPRRNQLESTAEGLGASGA